MAQPTTPPWIQTLQQRDPQFAESYLAQRERILQDGAIPAKYKLTVRVNENRFLRINSRARHSSPAALP